MASPNIEHFSNNHDDLRLRKNVGDTSYPDPLDRPTTVVSRPKEAIELSKDRSLPSVLTMIQNNDSTMKNIAHEDDSKNKMMGSPQLCNGGDDRKRRRKT